MPQRFLADEAQFAALKAGTSVVLAPLLATLETRLGLNSSARGWKPTPQLRWRWPNRLCSDR